MAYTVLIKGVAVLGVTVRDFPLCHPSPAVPSALTGLGGTRLAAAALPTQPKFGPGPWAALREQLCFPGM